MTYLKQRTFTLLRLGIVAISFGYMGISPVALGQHQPLQDNGLLQQLGEVDADAIVVASWKATSPFVRGSSFLEGNLLVTPAAVSSDLLITLYRDVPSPRGIQSERIATTLAFVRARSPIWTPDKTVSLPVSLQVPEDLPDGSYRLALSTETGHRITGTTSFPITRGIVAEQQQPAAIQVKANDKGEWLLTLPEALHSNAVVEAWLFTGQDNPADQPRLQATAAYELPAGQRELQLTLPATARWKSVDNGMLRFHIGGTPLVSQSQHIARKNTTASPVETFKPISHGTHQLADGTNHYWYADDAHALNWNGKAWEPFGGMFYLFDAKTDIRQRAQERIKINNLLDTLTGAGFSDLYVNMGVSQGSPDWYLQTVVDEFNKRDINFGWQLTTGAKPFTAWEIYSSTSQGLILAQSEKNDEISIDLPQTPTDGLLLIPEDGKGKAVYVPASLFTGVNRTGLQIAQILESERSTQYKRVTLDVPGLKPGKYYVLVNVIQRGKRVSNVWERLEETKEGLQWISRIDWGKGLRFFVDPVCNEGGINNNYETIRVSSTAFEAAFSDWLETKYHTIANLEKAWSLRSDSIRSFAEAARLLPLRDLDTKRDSDALTLVDPQTGQLLRTVDSPGHSWMDYLQAMRDTYAQRRDQVALAIKELVNVPIVMKRVSPWVSTEVVPSMYGGVDGIGLELYPENGSIVHYGGLSGRAEADLSPHTTWLLATELGYSAKPGNLGVLSWPDKQAFSHAVRETVALGAKGIYLFGWNLPGSEWQNHILLNQPERLAWAKQIADELNSNPVKPHAPYAIAFPEGQSWWWRSSSGRPWTRYNAVYRNPPSAFAQSMKLGDKNGASLWAVSTSVPIDAETVVINLQDAFFADYYAEQIDNMIDEGKNIIYLGHWPEQATTPTRLAQHFSGKPELPHPDGKGRIQPLKVLPGDEVLARDRRGNVWAKINRKDKLLIISVTPPQPASRNSEQAPQYLDSKWLEMLLEGSPNPR